MRDKWISFGCFITGFSYPYLRASSELSKKRVIKYTSALLIICVLWAFIGYAFTDRYLKGAWYSCIFGMFMMVFFVIQIERQIILSTKGQRLLHVFRIIIGLSMALIGTLIIDQVIFKEDIERKKMTTMGEEVKKILPSKTLDLRRQINEIDSTILVKDNERKSISDDINKNPFISKYERQVVRDSTGKETVTTIRRQVENPKGNFLQPLDKTIAELRTEKNTKEGMLLELRTLIENDLKQNNGFLDELEVMYSLLSQSFLTLFAWLIWFIFLLGLELFILVTKWGETENDYDRMMNQQMELHFKRIELLGSAK